MKNYIRKAQLKEKKYRDYGQVDFEDHEIEIIEEQTEKDMEAFGIEIK